MLQDILLLTLDLFDLTWRLRRNHLLKSIRNAEIIDQKIWLMHISFLGHVIHLTQFDRFFFNVHRALWLGS